MTDLRKAAEMALDVLRNTVGHSNQSQTRIDDAKHALVQALAQPEQEREWVGITYDEVYEFVCTTDSYINLAKAIEAKLKEKNGYPACPPCTHDCNEGRDCPARKNNG